MDGSIYHAPLPSGGWKVQVPLERLMLNMATNYLDT